MTLRNTLLAIPLVFTAIFLSVQPVFADDTCKIDLSLKITPDYIFADDDPHAKLFGTFSANEKCIPPFDIYVPTQEQGPNGPINTEKIVTTSNRSYQFRDEFTLGALSSFTEYGFDLRAHDSCAVKSGNPQNGYSNGLTGFVGACSVSSQVNGDALARAQGKHVCNDPFIVPDAGTFISERKSPGSNTGFFFYQEDPAEPPLKTKDITSVSIGFDPTYVADTIKNKKYTPKLPFSPLDVIQITIKTNATCLPPDYLKSRVFSGRLFTTNAQGERIQIDGGGFELVQPYTGGIRTYKERLSFNPSEVLIEAIAAGRSVYLEIRDTTEPEERSAPIVTSIAMTNCAQVYGSGEHKVVTMRGTSVKLSPQVLLAKSGENRAEGFEGVDPFKKYFDHFSFFVDFKNQNDTRFLKLNTTTFIATENQLGYIAKMSSCGKASVTAMYSDIEQTKPSGDSTIISLKGVASLQNHTILVIPSATPAQVVHEAGHAFAGLGDEYTQGTVMFGRVSVPNCSLDPKADFSYEGVSYGDAIQGCGADFFAIGQKSMLPPSSRTTSTFSIFRPSKTSIMNMDFFTPHFNVVSCGAVIKAIVGGSLKSHWPKCMGLDTVKPEKGV